MKHNLIHNVVLTRLVHTVITASLTFDYSSLCNIWRKPKIMMQKQVIHTGICNKSKVIVW